MPELGARSIETGVECHVKSKLCEEFSMDLEEISNAMNERALAKYDVRISKTSNGGDEVTVQPSGSTTLQSRKKVEK